jgi:DNA modification methylase
MKDIEMINDSTQSGHGTNRGEKYSEHEVFISIEDAVELTGFAAHYLRRLIRERKIRYRGGMADPLFPWADVMQLVDDQRPYWQLASAGSDFDPSLLLDWQGHMEPSSPERESHADNQWSPGLIAITHCIDWLKQIPRGTVQTVISSPPYWGQRRYADERAVQWADDRSVAFGREATVEEYVRHTLEIFRHLKRVLRPDGTIWWVIGDTYQTRTVVRQSTMERWENYQGKRETVWANNPDRRHSAGHPYLKDKDLTLVPFLVAHGAQRLGLFVRSIIIWSKQDPTNRSGRAEPSSRHMPEPVQDRPATGHEYILLLSRSSRYYFSATNASGEGGDAWLRNLRTVWSFPSSTDHGGHTAAFPLELPLRCIRLATCPGDLVIDPFAGSGNTLVAAKQLGRLFGGCDISPTYAEEARARLALVQPDSEYACKVQANGHSLEAGYETTPLPFKP